MNTGGMVAPRPLIARLAAVLLFTLLAGGCASQSSKPTNPEGDPWEPFNRKVHGFNQGVDKVLFKPVAKTYDVIMPDAPQRGVRNFFRNLQFPVTFVNLILQGKFEQSLDATSRFLLNSTAGLLGFFDIATREGMPDFDEDFGQTLAVWGWEESRYLVLPFLGPFTIRDLGGRGVAGYLSPTTYMIREHDNYWPLIIDLVSLRAELLPFDKDLEESNDPYSLIRDAYLQNREFRIYDGDPPAPDYDAMLEEE